METESVDIQSLCPNELRSIFGSPTTTRQTLFSDSSFSGVRLTQDEDLDDLQHNPPEHRHWKTPVVSARPSSKLRVTRARPTRRVSLTFIGFASRFPHVILHPIVFSLYKKEQRQTNFSLKTGLRSGGPSLAVASRRMSGNRITKSMRSVLLHVPNVARLTSC